MCKWGNQVDVFVVIPADLSHSGESYCCNVKVDSCIAPIVRCLNEAGIDTRGSCCGHGKADGKIELQDGRTIIIKKKKD